jgi:hypothetical protein
MVPHAVEEARKRQEGEGAVMAGEMFYIEEFSLTRTSTWILSSFYVEGVLMATVQTVSIF